MARVCRQAHKGGGILLGFGNYAGDVLNFGVAAERLRAEGIDVRIVPVTDDVASAPADMHEKRRGIAGDLVVFKIAGAAAEAGLSLDEVERLSRHANANTVSLRRCLQRLHLAGRTAPALYRTGRPDGAWSRHSRRTGDQGGGDPACLRSGKPAGGKTSGGTSKRNAKVGVILNGLGATKYEELFVLWTAIASLLEKAGLDTVAPEAGEFVTSLDMQGCSLTLLWLDGELERYWTAACDTPVLRRGEAIAVEPANDVIANEDAAPDFAKADEAGRAGGVCIQGILHAVADVLVEAEEELGRIDAFAGDGDHGQGMRRGSAAAKDAADQAVKAGAGTASVLAVAGDARADRAGGTSGVLWGLLLRSWSAELSDNGNIDDGAVVCGGRRALDAVTTLGRAKPGDKTLVDAFVPFVETLESAFASGKPLADAWKQAAEVAKVAAKATAPLIPKLGRARPLAEKSVGHPDAGAISLALVAEIVGKKLKS